MRAQGNPGTVKDAMREGLAEHKAAIVEAFGDGVIPDETLPRMIKIPAAVPNTIKALRMYIDAQSLKVA